MNHSKTPYTRGKVASFSTNARSLKALALQADSFFIQRGMSDRFVTPTFARQMMIVIVVLLTSISFGILFYPEHFLFWKYPLSALGATRAEDRVLNLPSIIFFDSGMIISSLLMFSVSACFKTSTTVQHRLIKRGLSTLSSFGFLVIIFPYNIDPIPHIIGGSAVFGGLWGLIMLLSLELRHGLGGLHFWLIQLILQGTILPYAAMFMLGSAVSPGFQKPAILGLMLAMILALWMKKN